MTQAAPGSWLRIGCVTAHPYPTDREIRVTRCAAALHEAGAEVTILCPANNTAAGGDFAHGRIVRFTPPGRGLFGRLLAAPYPINPTWFFRLFFAIRKYALEVLIIRDLRLALPGILAAKLLGARVILDLGENYPGMMQVVGKQKLAHHLIRNIPVIRVLEAVSVLLADQVWVVVEENRQRLIRYAGAANVKVISNYASAGLGPVPVAAQTPYSADGEPVELVFLGLIDNIRGLDLALDATARLLEEYPNVVFHIHGDGPSLDTLTARAQRLGIMQQVRFHGWANGADKYEILARADIGILLHTVCELTNTTMPNKLFDYMRVGLPVVATLTTPVTRVVRQAGCGVLVEESAPKIAQQIGRLVGDVKMREDMGRAGVVATHSCYAWEKEARKIVENITGLLGLVSNDHRN